MHAVRPEFIVLFGINNVVIEKVNNIKYLGFIIDRELKLKTFRIYEYM